MARRGVMRDFIHRKNIEHYRKLLSRTADDAKRKVFQKLLAEEEAKDQLPGRMAASASRSLLHLAVRCFIRVSRSA
jgi:hypothetical protein